MSSVTRQVEVGPHRIEATILGSGMPAVVIEPGLGGTAASWRSVAEAVAEDTTVVIYDRVPYGASSRAQDARTPRDIARDLNGVLDALGIGYKTAANACSHIKAKLGVARTNDLVRLAMTLGIA